MIQTNDDDNCFQIFIHMMKNIPSANVGAVITGLLCLFLLIGLKEINVRFKDKLKVPIPAELLVVRTFISLGQFVVAVDMKQCLEIFYSSSNKD